MRLLFNAWRDLTHPLAGGSEVFVDELARGLHARGHDVAMLSSDPVSRHEYRAIANGGRFTHYARSPVAYRRHFRDREVVVDVANGMTYYTPLYRTGTTICLVHHIHRDHWSYWFSPPMAAVGRFLEARAMPLAYRNCLFVAVSPSTRDSLVELGVDPAAIRIVYNGVHVPDAPEPEAPEPTFLALGRLVPHKRFHLLMEAWPRVRAATGGRLVIAGEGPERARLEAAATDGVEFAGKVTEAEKARLLDRAWFLVHPAELEGWGLVVMEAAARRTPTLGFRVGGVRDSVVDGETGLLVETTDELAARWIDLALDRERRLRMGDAARRRASEFGWSRTVDRFEEVADEALALDTPPGRWIPVAVRASSPVRAARPAVERPRVVAPRATAVSLVVSGGLAAVARGLDRIADQLDPSTVEVVALGDRADDRGALAELTDRCRTVVRLPDGSADVRRAVHVARGRTVVVAPSFDGPLVLRLVAKLADAHVAVASTTRAFRAASASLLHAIGRPTASDGELLDLAGVLGMRVVETGPTGAHARDRRPRSRPGAAGVLSYLLATDASAPPDELAGALRGRLRANAPVVASAGGALVLLPGGEAEVVERVAGRLADELPDVDLRAAQCHARTLLSPHAAPVRSALVDG